MIFTEKEGAWIVISVIILTFIIGFTTDIEKQKASLSFILPLIASVIIILTSVTAKKLAAPYYNIEIEHRVWGLKQFGFYRRTHFKKPFPIGLILPFFLTLLSLGMVKPMAILQFDAKNLPQKRILRKTGNRLGVRKEEMNDCDPAFTSAWGFYSLLIVSIIAIFIEFPILAKSSIYYGLWNLIPIGQLDGSKLFFGSVFAWIILIVLYLLSFGLVIFL